MNIACLSGKGGAGKTLISVNLAAAAGHACYIDCDVEEPNGRLFFHPAIKETIPVATLLPEFDSEKCNGCKACVEFCRFHALIYIREKPMLFPEVCHSCGGCQLVCPQHAVSEKENPVGCIEIGIHRNVKVVTGVLNTGEASGIPVIQKALSHAESPISIIDCPPGSSCSVMECIQNADYCILVAEPTAFGFHNFKMVYELTALLKKPCGVVVNKADYPYSPLDEFCKSNHLKILAEIPYHPEIAELVSSGEIIAEHPAVLDGCFEQILTEIRGDIR